MYNMPHEDISGPVERWLQGDDTAFEAIFHYYRQRLLRYTFRYLKNETDAEDLTMEILVKVWQCRQSVTNPATFENYLFTIARNRVIKSWQQKVDSLLSFEPGQEPAVAAETSDPVLYGELVRQYQESLAGLPEQRRRIFLLHREQNLTYKEIARQLNISPKTVENQISATLKQLRTHLAQHLASLIL